MPGEAPTLRFWLFICLGLVGVAVLAYVCMAQPTPTVIATLSTAGALSVITGGSVAIERALEAFWTVIDMTLGGEFPHGPQANKLGMAVRRFCSPLAEKLKRVDADAKKVLGLQPDADRKEAVNKVLGHVAALRSTLATTAGRVDHGTISTAVASAQGHIDAIVARYPQVTDETSINEIFDDANVALTELRKLLASFDSNPARRLVSIVIGANVGLVVAYVLGLNVFTAASGTQPPGARCSSIWIAVTGLVMGLGSTPTHELIKAIQEHKRKNQKAG